jgi:hypothetical protein
MKLSGQTWGTVVALALASGLASARDSKVVDGVRVGDPGPPAPAVLSSSSVDFETPELFSDTLPLQVFQTFQTTALFRGTGAVIDVASFEVTGTTGDSALGFNGRTAVNGDGSIPRLPELVIFVAPNLRALSPKQTVSVDVGSKRDEGRFVVLIALNRTLNVLDFDFVQVTPQMQTLTVSSPSPDIALVALFGEAELKILVADNLTYN